MELATFGAGCFWGIEAQFRQVEGVTDAIVGYTGGGEAGSVPRREKDSQAEPNEESWILGR